MLYLIFPLNTDLYHESRRPVRSGPNADGVFQVRQQFRLNQTTKNKDQNKTSDW